ncbi:Aep2p NDAI_0K00340 [Naumovozyma dairenensis CBS 421]|uniref:ATPase expression protein 2, mitochondrial n=1 Tax=Naumovozyma dairenensis (strain ATCC 10597 / BCRC 20456 / CBS 421 / NBRC 0211 / NRRL Y-12639) TaxID=1071378 RepID=G0WHG2_NAUDC|nr:hypothetical protein NDAI_0K00340 [Naumovozyma dairenensis CBS 421]CCD27223.1 hypothetical protein NDAI_0K00340 [Naumovozyma dairenensis CBS 421]
MMLRMFIGIQGHNSKEILLGNKIRSNNVITRIIVSRQVIRMFSRAKTLSSPSTLDELPNNRSSENALIDDQLSKTNTKKRYTFNPKKKQPLIRTSLKPTIHNSKARKGLLHLLLAQKDNGKVLTTILDHCLYSPNEQATTRQLVKENNHLTTLLSHEEMSIFICRVLKNFPTIISEKKYEILTNEGRYELYKPEVIFSLFNICKDEYCNNTNQLNPLMVYDLNQFIKYFLREGQLKKAQLVLDYIIDRFGGIEQLIKSKDLTTLDNHLKLKNGAIYKNWKPLTDSESNTFLQYRLSLEDKSHNFKGFKNYKFLDGWSLLKIIDMVLTDKTHCLNILNESILYSLGTLRQIEFMEHFIKQIWDVHPDDAVEERNHQLDKYNLPPDTNELIAILTSYCQTYKSMDRAFLLLDKLIQKYPEPMKSRLNDNKFWIKMLQWGIKIADKNGNNVNGTTIDNCLEIMEEWFLKGKKKTALEHWKIDDDYGSILINLLHNIMKERKNVDIGLKAIENFVQKLKLGSVNKYYERNLTHVLYGLQKCIFRKIAESGSYNKGLALIDNGAYTQNSGVESMLREYYITTVKEIRSKRSRRNKAQSNIQDREQDEFEKLQQKYDEIEEEGMIIGKLW